MNYAHVVYQVTEHEPIISFTISKGPNKQYSTYHSQKICNMLDLRTNLDALYLNYITTDFRV